MAWDSFGFVSWIFLGFGLGSAQVDKQALSRPDRVRKKEAMRRTARDKELRGEIDEALCT